MKKTAITLLALIAMLSFTAFFSCSKKAEFEAAFKADAPSSVALSDEVDLLDFIVLVNGADYTVSVKYTDVVTGNEREEIFGGENLIFAPKQVGEHNLTYTVTLDGASKSSVKKLIVEYDDPSLTVSHDAINLMMGKTGSLQRSFTELLDEAGLTFKPVSAYAEVKAGYYREFTFGVDDDAGEWKDVGLGSDETFVFDKTGEYRFDFNVISGDKETEDYILVNVIDNPSQGTENGEGISVIETGKNVVYSDENPYAFKLLAAPSSDTYRGLSYAVISGEHAANESVSVLFSGKNIPQIGLHVKSDETAVDPYGIYYVSQGNWLSFRFRETEGYGWVMYGPTMMNGIVTARANSKLNDDLNFGRENLEDDKDYLLKTSFHKDAGTNSESFRVEIYEVESYTDTTCKTGECVYSYDSETYRGAAIPTNGSMVIYGDSRNNINVQYVPEDNIDYGDGLSGFEKINTDAFGARYNEATGEYKLLAGSFLNDVNNGHKTYYSYVGLGEYKTGNALQFTFTGKNIPNLALFTDTNNGQAAGGGTGLFLQSSYVNGGANSQRFSVLGPYRLDSGNPADYTGGYKAICENNKAYIDGVGVSNGVPGDSPVNQSPFGYLNLEDGVEYRYTVGTQYSLSGASSGEISYNGEAVEGRFVKLYFMLDRKTEEGYERIKTITFNYEHRLPDLENTFAVVYGASNEADCVFKVEKLETLPEYQVEYNEDGSVTLAATSKHVEVATPFVYYQDSAFLGLGAYEIGDRLRFKFTGKNIPNVVLFADVNGGQQVHYGTGIAVTTSREYPGSSYAQTKYFTVSGPHRLSTGTESSGTYLGRTDLYFSDARKSVAAQKAGSLLAFENLNDGTEYIYDIITEKESDTNIRVTATLYTPGSEGKLVYYASESFSIFVNNEIPLTGRYAVAYGAAGETGAEITFSFENTPAADIPDEEVVQTVYAGTVSGDKVTLEQKADGFILDANGNSTDLAYASLGEYNVGDTLVIRATGPRLPNLVLFADVPGGQLIGGGTGYAMLIEQAGQYHGRTYFTGPNRLETGDPSDYDNYDYSGFGINEQIQMRGDNSFFKALEDSYGSVAFTYTVKTSLDTDKNLTFLFSLASDDNITYMPADFTVTIPYGEYDENWLSGRYAIAYGNEMRAAEFTFEIIPAE